MQVERLRALLQAVAKGEVSSKDAEKQLASLPFADLEFARVDRHRELRTGFSEVVYAPGKKASQIRKIAQEMVDAGQRVLITRLSPSKSKKLKGAFANAVYHNKARALVIQNDSAAPLVGTIAVVCAGTSDIEVAEEAIVTAEFYGASIERIYDVGVAGLHRLLGHREKLEAADVCIVIAGMEGALPSVVGGLISTPVVAVPTSVGYGSNFQGLSALLAMLNSCASSIAVVNIDNGFGAAQFAVSILKKKN